MIRSLEGKISSVFDNQVVVSVQGVGYLVNTPTAKHNYLLGEETFFHTYLAVRETALDIYGFTEETSLVIFELLLTVPKIGPKSALQITCQADNETLIASIKKNDPEYLHKMSGVGKKTAQNLINHLSGKVDTLSASLNLENTGGTSFTQNQGDAIDALITLGYDPKEARTYVMKEDRGNDTKTLVQAVLKNLPLN